MDRPFSSPARGVMGWSFWGHSKRPGQCQQDIKVSRPATGHLSLLVSFGGPSTPSAHTHPRRSTEAPLHHPSAGAEGPPWRRRCSWTSLGSPPGRSPAATLPHCPGQSPRPARPQSLGGALLSAWGSRARSAPSPPAPTEEQCVTGRSTGCGPHSLLRAGCRHILAPEHRRTRYPLVLQQRERPR